MSAILLQGGAEFGGKMADSDRRGLELAGGFDVQVSIIPAAAAPDKNHQRAGKNGVRWFQSLGAKNVVSLPLIDRESADDPGVLSVLRQSRLIYLLGGFPHYLGQSLAGSLAWRIILERLKDGAVIAGSSAGAMVLCSHYFDPHRGRIVNGLNLLSNACVLPHHNTFGQKWAPRLLSELPDSLLIGIDEETGMIRSGRSAAWQVVGKGSVTLYKNKDLRRFESGADFKLWDEM